MQFRGATRSRARIALLAALLVALLASCEAEETGNEPFDAGRPDTETGATGGTTGSDASTGGTSSDAAGGSGGGGGTGAAPDGSSGSGGQGAGGGDAGMAGAAGASGAAGAGSDSGTDACEGVGNGVHCGAQLSEDPLTRYFCRAGVTLGIGTCQYGCHVASGSCSDPGGGATQGSGYGSAPGGGSGGQNCNSCVLDDCGLDRSACMDDSGCVRLFECAKTCLDSACLGLCQEIFSEGASLYTALLMCVELRCPTLCGTI